MIRIVMLAGVLATSVGAANAQEAPGNPEAGRLYAREVCSPCHPVTPEQASQRTIAIAPDFQTIANTPGMTASALRALFADAAPQDAESDPGAGPIGRCDRLPAEPARPPTAGSKTLNLI